MELVTEGKQKMSFFLYFSCQKAVQSLACRFLLQLWLGSVKKSFESVVSVPAPEDLCLCEQEGADPSRSGPCTPCWALGPEAAAGADPAYPRLWNVDGLHADGGGARPGGPVCVCP